MSGKGRHEEDKSRDSEIEWPIVFVSCSSSAIHLLHGIIIQILNIILREYYHPNCQYNFFLFSQSPWETWCSAPNCFPRILFPLFHFLFLFRWLWKIFEDIVFGSTLALLSTLRAVKTSTSNPHTATGLTLLPLFYFSFLSYHPFSIYLLSLFL